MRESQVRAASLGQDTRLRAQIHVDEAAGALGSLHVVKGLAPEDEEMVRVVVQDMDRPAVCRSGGCHVRLPLVDLATELVGIDMRPVGIRHNDSPVWPSAGAPGDVWGCVRDEIFVDDDGKAFRQAEVQRGVRKPVVNGVVGAVGA